MVAPSRAETGCIQYDLNRDPDSDSVFWFVEKWNDQAALDLHNETPHFKELQEVLPDLIQGADRFPLKPV